MKKNNADIVNKRSGIRGASLRVDDRTLGLAMCTGYGSDRPTNFGKPRVKKKESVRNRFPANGKHAREAVVCWLEQ